ncbi:TolC family protein [Bordetella genomosp. 12]|uniref:Transporter n=1 Tax=Bordetella genomosp. 12 TaxID=463035 RepID=A0A261VCN5_9BORD|nr:TolC family protein [Bordetella genomosp. 12]OZI71597.1 transporter [Bordetella genomosp. 12]
MILDFTYSYATSSESIANVKNETSHRRVPRLAMLVAAMAVVGLSGCAIQPKPFSDAERAATARNERSVLFVNQQPVTGPITLDEAMARAVRYNLDHRLKMMEEALSQRQLDLSNFNLLPKLTAQAGYSNRNRELASGSEGLYTGQESLIPSFSTDKDSRTADLSLSWNLLDFGVSYFEAQQQADHVLVLEQRRRKVVQMLMQQVRESYWQTLGAQRLRDRIGPLLDQARAALADSRREQSQGLRSPITTLNYQRTLLDLMRQLEAVRDQLEEAKPRLAALMNMDPGTDFTLASSDAFIVPVFDMPMEKMEDMALQRRPELVEASYNERIGVNETHKAIAKLLPGIELSLGTHYDSNSFLVYNSWRSAGVRISWNLLNLLNAGNIRDAAQAQLDVAQTQRMALSMAVLSQVHIARNQLAAKTRQYNLFKEANDVDQQILRHTQNATSASAQGKLEEIRVSTAAMMSELRQYQSYGELESAYGRMLATLGLDPLGDKLSGNDLAALTASIAQEQQRWNDLAAQAPTHTAALAAAPGAGDSAK